MVTKVTLVTNEGKFTDMFNDNATLSDVYQKFDCDYTRCSNTVNSVPLKYGDVNKTLAELEVGSEARLTSIVKADCAAEILVMGDAAVVKSSVKLEDWKKVLKYCPDIGITDEDTGETVFKVFVDENSPGSLTKHGCVFGGRTDSDGYAMATIMIDPNEENREEAVKELLGLPLVDLNSIEENIPEALDEAKKIDAEIEENIHIL